MKKVRLSNAEKLQLQEVIVNGRQYFKVIGTPDSARLLSADEVEKIRETTRKANRLFDKAMEVEEKANPNDKLNGVREQAKKNRHNAVPAYSYYANRSQRQAERHRKAVKDARSPRSKKSLEPLHNLLGGSLIRNYVKAIRQSAMNGHVGRKTTAEVLRWFKDKFYDPYVLLATIEDGAMLMTSHQRAKLPDASTVAYDWYYDFLDLYADLMALGMPDYAQENHDDLDRDQAIGSEESDW